MNTTVLKIMPYLLKSMGLANLYFFGATVSLATVFYCLFFLPETQGKSASDLGRLFSREEEKQKEKEAI